MLGHVVTGTEHFHSGKVRGVSLRDTKGEDLGREVVAFLAIQGRLDSDLELITTKLRTWLV